MEPRSDEVVIRDSPPYFLDLNAPKLPAKEVIIDGVEVWRVWYGVSGAQPVAREVRIVAKLR